MSQPTGRAMTANQRVAANVRRLRIAQKLTQAEAAQLAESHLGKLLSVPSWSAMERSVDGTRVKAFDADEIEALARTFGVQIPELFSDIRTCPLCGGDRLELGTSILVGRSHSDMVRYVRPKEEITDRVEFDQVELNIEPRDWDVTDPARQEAFARAELGDAYDWHRDHISAQLWINVERNAAGMAVYRDPLGVV